MYQGRQTFHNKRLYRDGEQDDGVDVLRCVLWNIEELTLSKTSDSEFVNPLCEFDIICLNET